MSDEPPEPFHLSGCLFGLAALGLFEMLVHWGVSLLGWIDYAGWWWAVSWTLLGSLLVGGVLVALMEKK